MTNWLVKLGARCLPLGLLLAACTDPYPPAVPTSSQSYLVVDGFINPLGSTVVRLSRTLPLASAADYPAETQATVSVRDEAGTSYALAESPAGTYTSAALTLDPGRRYQLRISTARGRVYESGLVRVKLTPPIDNLRWQATPDGVRVLVSAIGLNNSTRLYRWDYVETWQFRTNYYATVEFVRATNTVVPRQDNINVCWRTENSTTIKQANTNAQVQDVVANYPLLTVPYDEKLRFKYSVLVQQYAQTPEEYTYWDILGKSTQNLGTPNDPLPSQLVGNVRCLTDASEPVVGYVGAHSMTQQRLFIDYADLGRPTIVDHTYDDCQRAATESVAVRDAVAIFRQGVVIPHTPLVGPGGVVTGYLVGTPFCVDCRTRGTNVKPSFWP